MLSIGTVSVSSSPHTGSPLDQSMVSPPILPRQSTARDRSVSVTPNPFLTPTVPAPSSTLSSTSPTPVTPSPSVPRTPSPSVPGTPSPSVPASPSSTPPKCRYCLQTFATQYSLNRHLNSERCIFEYNARRHSVNNYCVLTRPPNYQQTIQILQQLALSERVRIAQLNNWAIPGLWPLVFPGQYRQRGQMPPILEEMTAGRQSAAILADLLRESPSVTLPTQVILMDSSQNIQSVLSTGILTPGVSFRTQISGENMTVTSGIYMHFIISFIISFFLIFQFVADKFPMMILAMMK